MTTSKQELGRKRRPLVVAAIVCLALVALLIAVIASSLFYISTPSGSKRVMAFVQERLARDYDTTFSFDDARIEPLSGVHFKNLRILKPLGKPVDKTLNKPPAAGSANHDVGDGSKMAPNDGLKAKIEIASFDVEFDFSIWRRKLEIKQLILDHASIVVRMASLAVNEEISAEPTDNENLFLKFQDLVENPPATLRAPNIEIRNMDLDVHHAVFSDETAAAQVQSAIILVHDLNFSGGFIFEPADLQLTGKTKTAKENLLSLEMKDPRTQKTTFLETQPFIDGDWNLKIQKDGTNWSYVVDPFNLLVQLEGVHARVVENTSRMEARIPFLETKVTAQILAQSQILFQLDKEAFQTVDIKSAVQFATLSFEQTAAPAAPLRITAEDQTLRLRSHYGSQVPTLTDQQSPTQSVQPGSPAAGTAAQTERPAKEILSQVEFEIRRLTAPAYLTKPISMDSTIKAKLSSDLKHLTLNNKTNLEKIPLLDLELHLDFLETLAFLGSLKAKAPVELGKIVKPAASLNSVGSVQASGKFKGQWNGLSSKTSLQAESQILAARFGDWNITTNIVATLPSSQAGDVSGKHVALTTSGQTTITQVRATSAIPTQFKLPFTLDHEVDLTAGTQTLKASGSVPNLVLPKLANISGMQWTFAASSPDFSAQKDVVFKTEFKQDKLSLANADALSISQFLGMRGSLRGSLRQGSTVNLDAFDLHLAQPSVQAFAEGLGDILKKTGSLRGELKIRLPKGFSPIAGHQMQGNFTIPASLVLRPLDRPLNAISDSRSDNSNDTTRAKKQTMNGTSQVIEITLGGSVDMKDVGWKKEQLSIAGLSGRVPFNEKLVWDRSHLRFTHQLKQNPFERVDFERVRPLLQGTDSLRISQIQWEDRRFGPFIGFFSVRQNMLFAHQFDLNMGSGTVHGQMFLDANPSNLALGILSRLSDLDVREILPKKFLTRVPPGPTRLAGRTGLVIDLNRLTVDGRMDITEIGGAQLVALVNVLDPLYEDDKLNKVRSLLQIGYPTGIELAFAEGYMNMDIALSALGFTKRQSVRGIPISTLLAKSTKDFVQQAQKGPLR